MKKIISILLCAVLLIFASILPASAEEEFGTVTQAYFMDQTLTVFFRASDSGSMDNSVAYLKMGDRIYPNSVPVKSITDYDEAVNYLLVIDVSDSMEDYRDKIADFVQGMLEYEQKPYSVTVAAMGESFRILQEDITSADQAVRAIDRINFTDHVSEICDGVIRAIEYLSDREPESGVLQNIVLITDGETYLSNSGFDGSGIRQDADGAKRVIADSPEYLIHTVCTGSWNETTFDAISITPGLDLQIPYFSGGTAYGVLVSNFVDGMYRVDIPYNLDSYESRVDAELIVSSTDTGESHTIPLTDVRNYDVKQYRYFPHYEDGVLVGQDYIPEDSTDSDIPTEAVPTAAPADPSESTDAPSEEPSGGSDASEPTAAPSAPATADEAGKDDDEFKILGLAWWIVALILGGILLLVALILVLLVIGSRKKKRASTRTTEQIYAAPNAPAAPSADPYMNAPFAPNSEMYPSTQAPAGGCIVMKPELLYGSAHCSSAELQLYDQLFIGTASDCDIVVEDSMASPHNTRVFLEGGVVYIEDLNENSCTYVGGMKIFSKNRLRSGEEIIVGDTSFKLRF